MKDEIWEADGSATDSAKRMNEAYRRRRRVRMTRAPGQTLVLSSLGLAGGDTGPIEIRFAEVGAGGAATLDFLLPDHVFVEHKETMDSVQAWFCLQPPSYRGWEE